MKKMLILTTAILFNFTNAQFTIMKLLDEKINYVHNTVSAKEGGVQISYSDIVGSPYPDKNFKEAKIANNYRNEMVRYNAFRDDVEFKEGNNIMLIPKEEKFNRIEIIPNKEVLVYLDLDPSLGKVYYYELVKQKISLYKKIVIEFSDFKKAESSFKNDEQASFYQSPTLFYIEVDGRVLKSPKKEKDIMEFFPDKKDKLKSFFKEYKIKLNKEEELKKLVNFLNQ